MDFDFLKDRYDYELQRKEQLTAALTLPVGVLTVLGGAIVAMARSFSYQDALLAWPFGLLVAVDVGAFFACLLYLGKAYHRQKYIYLPLLARLEEWENDYERSYAVSALPLRAWSRRSRRTSDSAWLRLPTETQRTTTSAAGCCIGRVLHCSPSWS